MDMLCMILVCGGTAVGLWVAAARAMIRRRRIARTPTTPLASVVEEGRVEVQGRVEAVGETLASPADGSPCAWLEVEVRAIRSSSKHMDIGPAPKATDGDDVWAGSASDSGKNEVVRPVLEVTIGDEVWLRDDSGRGVVDMSAATVDLPDGTSREWMVEDDPPAEAIADFLDRHGQSVARIRKEHEGFRIDYQERRLLVGGPLHVTGMGSRVEDTRGEAAGYRGSPTVARLTGPELHVSAASEEAILRSHRRDAVILGVLGAIAMAITLLFATGVIRP